MLSAILNSDRAVKVSIYIIKAFVRLRQILSTHKYLAQKLNNLEQKHKKHEIEIEIIFETIRKMIDYDEKPKNKIGFKV